MIVHILWFEDYKFLSGIVGTVNDEPDLFGRDGHLFVTPHEGVFEACRAQNVLLDTEFGTDRPFAELINKYAPEAESVIVHALEIPQKLLKVKRKYLGKIIWRSWGFDSFYPYAMRGELKDIPRAVLKRAWLGRIRKLKAVCGENIVDEIVLEGLVGDKVPVLQYSYHNPKHDDRLSVADFEGVDCGIDFDDSAVNVMLGHSGVREEHHIEMLEKLAAYRGENMHIYLGLGYGYEDYIQELKDYVARNWGDQVTIITKMMPLESYFSYLSKIDVAIFDGLQSYALGNICPMIEMGKKFVVNPDGPIRKAFDRDGVPYLTSDTAFDLPFEEFSAPAAYGPGAGSQINCDRQSVIRGLNEVFELARS